MIAAVFASALRVLRRPALFVPAIAISMLGDAGIFFNGWPRAGVDGMPPERAVTCGILILLARGWLSLTLVAVAIALARGASAGLLRNWVHVLRALQIAAVSLALLVLITIGTFLLVLPGIYLLLRWSQVVPVLIDRRGRVMDATRLSEAIASAYYLHILAIWAIAGSVSFLVPLAAASLRPWLATLTIPHRDYWELALTWGWQAVASTAGMALMGALYVELDRRAFGPAGRPIVTGL